ncbi:prepilin-type N-terminal cleavage/methylation domain-containing protein [uncultured Desulfobacter sp.]|uniref:type IV pilus modification PilV family protein n=1 Tax=uncultured Desulfobacter sp. TaxID=240139 RepID=UPI0029F4E8B2|nr:prepilin-type N-terminal cleavage/methylation domain-containing protein [uncultured Desulfobacter sp.]
MKFFFRSSEGFTLFEILIALVILGTAIIPIMDAMAPSMASIPYLEKEIVLTNRARGTLNRIIALDFDTLTANVGNPVDITSLFGSITEGQKEIFTHFGVVYQPIIAIEDESGGDNTLLKLSVTLANLKLTTLKTNE